MADISKVNVNSTDYDLKDQKSRDALAEVIDGGAAGTKNHCTLASGSNTPPARWINIPVSDVGVGQWVMSFGTLTSTDTDDTFCQAICFNSSDKQVSNWVNFKRESNTNKTFTTTDNVSYVRLYPANSYATSEGDTVTFTDAMLSPKVLYDADPSYVPYAQALTNIILTPAVIKAVDEGAKNRIVFDGVGTGTSNIGTSYTSNGIMFEVQSDGTVHVTGTISSGFSYCYFYTGTSRINIVDFFDGNHVLSGNPQGASESTYRLWYKVGSQTAVSVGDSSVILPEVTGETNAVLGMQVNAPKTNLDIIFKPMICTAEDWAVSPKFVPYALPNPVITPALIEQVESGAKNLLRFDETSTDNNNVRFTVNADGSITATQIAARTATAVFRMRYTDNLLSQDVRGKILSGCPSGGSDSTYKINIERRTYPYKNYGRDAGNGLLIPDTIADDIPLYLYIQVYSSVTLPLTFKPMICTAADYAVSQKFVPYAPTNRGLYEKCETKVTMRQIYDIPPVSIIPAEGETADLNDYVTPGTYLVSTSNLASRIINAPFTDKGYKIEVEQYRSGNYYKQTIFPWAEPGAFYIRTRAGGATWSSWYKFEGTEVT